MESKTNKTLRGRASSAFLFLMLMCSPAFTQNSNNQIDIFTTPIVQRKNLVNQMTYEELRSVYTLDTTRWSTGQPITVVIMDPSSYLQKRFLWEYFGISAPRYAELIDSKIQIDSKTKPKIAQSTTEMISIVNSTPGAVGFISKQLYVGNSRRVKPLVIK